MVKSYLTLQSKENTAPLDKCRVTSTMSTDAEIRIATYNVHGFSEGMDRIEEIIRREKPDVLCLQEAGKHKASALHSNLRDMFSARGLVTRHGCAILSKFPLTQTEKHGERKRKPRFVAVRVDAAADLSLSLVNLHLNHRWEHRRKGEFATILREVSSPDVICGDFNSLTLDDYDDNTLASIAAVREANNWEMPIGDVIDLARHQYRLVDSKSLSPTFSGPLSTCRFDTRIDYVFLNGSLLVNGARVLNHRHIADAASDHNAVIVDLRLAIR